MPIVVFAEYAGQLSCAEVKQNQAAGLLSRATESDFEPFLQRNPVDFSAYRNAETLLSLGATWSPGYAGGLTVVLGVLALGGLSLYPLGLLLGKLKPTIRKRAELLQEKPLDLLMTGWPPAADLASVVKARAAAGLCPKCGGQVAPTDQNCPTCRINRPGRGSTSTSWGNNTAAVLNLADHRAATGCLLGLDRQIQVPYRRI